MKIGILTFHRAENFGAVMQCWALQTYLQSLGHDVYVVDYRCRAIERVYSIFNPWILVQSKRIFTNLEQYFERVRSWKYRRTKKHQYIVFRDRYLNMTPPVHTVSQLPEGYDCFIVGSDQVWNCGLTGGLDEIYFLDTEIGTKKISYAASSEWYSYGDYKRNAESISRCLDGFDYLSVREDRLRVELSQYTTNIIYVCIDPTFLLPKEQFFMIASRPKIDNYILVYHLSESSSMSNLAKSVSIQTGMKVIEVHAGFAVNDGDEYNLYNLGPTDLLGYILHSEMVLTTSFHGLAFSLIFRKNFWVIDNGVSSRQKNLLQTLSLENRIIPDGYQGNLLDNVDYLDVSLSIDSLVRSSKDFLKQALTK